MNVTRVATAEEFLHRATPLLLEHEAENNLLLGLPQQIDRPAEALFCLVYDGDRIVGAALQTDPPHNLLLSHMCNDAAVALADGLTDELGLPGIQGSASAVECFAQRWVQTHDTRARGGMHLGIYALTRVISQSSLPGEMRAASANDLPLVMMWMREFKKAVADRDADENFEEVARERIAASSIYLWCDKGRPVSIAAATGTTPNGIRVALVYTPPPLRRRGYASALVAVLSLKLLDSGREFCFLFTDMTNPTSNRIYQRIGYQKIGEQRQIVFER